MLQTWCPAIPEREFRYRLIVYALDRGALACRYTFETESLAPASRLITGDFDGNGATDIAFTIEPAARAGSDLGEARLMVSWNYGGVIGLLEPVGYQNDELMDGADTPRFLRVAKLQDDFDPAEELVLYGGEDWYQLDFSPDRRPEFTRLPRPGVVGARVLRAFDVNGAGLDDLVLSTGTELRVFMQDVCGARGENDGTCTRRPGTPSTPPAPGN